MLETRKFLVIYQFLRLIRVGWSGFYNKETQKLNNFQ